MQEIQKSEQAYVEGMQKIFSDPETRKALEEDPEGTLERLGFDLDDRARKELRKGPVDAELSVAAVPAVLVRVATNGTRPAVSVVVRSSTVSATRGRSAEILDADLDD
ncbi:MAG: hypothetical protein AAFX04_02340 [Pseudomonadota bacterium]